MNKHLLTNKAVIQLAIIVIFYFILRIPLIDKALWHDEIYNTSVYLHALPTVGSASEKNLSKGISWATDWQRQIAIHPPFVSLFYYYWISFFGDSEISLNIPVITIGLAGIVILYFFSSLVFVNDVCFIATLATVFSASHISYSVEAVHAIFEILIFLSSLLFLYKLIITKNNILFRYLLVLNVLGVFVFYHYFIYLVLQTVILWFFKDTLKIHVSYFTTIFLISAMFSVFVMFNFCNHRYYYDNCWPKNNLLNTAEIIFYLPGFKKQAVMKILFFSLFSFYLLGIFYMLRVFIKNKDVSDFLKIMLNLFFFIPFLLYFLLGLINIRFGWERNFFYLLPIYFLTIFYGLSKIFSDKKYYFVITAIILVLILYIGILKSTSWEMINLDREMIRYAAKFDCRTVIFSSRYKAQWHFIYYANKYGITDKVLFCYKGAPEDRKAIFLKKIQDRQIFVIIEPFENGTLVKDNKYHMWGKWYEIIKKEDYKFAVGPFQLFKEILGFHQLRIAVYYCRKGNV